jgi:hypothetical protein
MGLVCIECAKSRILQEHIKANGVLGVCSICTENNQAVDYLSNDFAQLIKALIRLHYSEIEYNEHWGGDHNKIRIRPNRTRLC